MGMARAAQHAVSLAHGHGGRRGVLCRPTPAAPLPSFRPLPLQARHSQSGKNSRLVNAISSKLFIWATTDTKTSASRLRLAKLPSATTVITALTIFVILPGLLCGSAQACEAIKASSLGLKFASFLRQTGWPDEAIVFVMAMLPVLELRGAIPVGYWMHMDPFKLSVLALAGNMVPVPFIILYMEKLADFLSNRSSAAKEVMDGLFAVTRRKAAPVQEFEWLGLMLFVAVPFPGTGAWTGAMVASVLGMPFGEAISANFFGVVMAGLLVNLLVNLGLKYAVMMGIALFLISTFMWGFLRAMRRSEQ